MRIGFNGRPLTSNQVRGFLRHTLGLVSALRQIAPELEIHFFSDIPIHPENRERFAGCHFHDRKFRPHLHWLKRKLPASLDEHRIDVFHSTINNDLPPRQAGRRLILTMHDTFSHDALRALPMSLSPPAWRNYFNWSSSWRIARASADRIITVSEFSRGQIVGRYPDLASRLSVIPNGVDERFRPERDTALHEQLTALDLVPAYYFYVGGYEERKNVSLLLSAYRMLRENARGNEVPALVLAGESTAFRQNVGGLAQTPGTRWLGRVDDALLPSLYAGAIATVVPSILEGFGLPVVESMACGTPVLAADSSALPEIGGEAALYFPFNDATALASLMERIHRDPQWRSQRVRLGLERARWFNWAKIAQQTLKIYQEAAGR